MKKIKENFHVILIGFVILVIAVVALIVYLLSNPKETTLTFEIEPQTIEAGIYNTLETFILNIEKENDDELTYSEIGSIMNFDTPGEYVVTLRLDDESGNFSEETITITVEDTIGPTFTVTDQEIEIGHSDVNWIEYITDVSDNSNGVIIKAELVDNVDYNSLGIYTVTVKVSDGSLNDTTQTFNVEVVGDLTPPTFDIITEQTIEVGTVNIDWSTYITNEADNQGGIITKTEVLDNVDYNTVGIYTVTVKAVDESLNETTQTFNVVVEASVDDPDIPIDEPMFNPFANPDYDVSSLSEGWDFTDINPLDLMTFQAYDYGTYITSSIILDNSNNIYISDEYRYIPSLHGMYLVQNMDINNKLYGMVDPNFEIIVEVMYDAVQPFVNGYTNISLDGLNATIDLEGNIIHDWQPNLIFPAIEKDIWLIVEDFDAYSGIDDLISYFIDIDGNKISEDFILKFVNSSISPDNIYDMGYSYHQFERPFTMNSITVEVDGFYGVYDFSGQIIIETNNWNIVYHEEEDIYYRRYYETPGEISTNKMEFVDSDGVFLFDYSPFTYYDPRSEFFDGLLSIQLNNTNNLLINTSGEIIYESLDITTLYNNVYIEYNVSYDMALKNIDGEMLSLDYYDKIEWHYNSPFIVTHFDGTMQFMDYTGELLYSAYSTLLPYDGNYAIYSIAGNYYAIDRDGVTTHITGTNRPVDIFDDYALNSRNLLDNAGEPQYDMLTGVYSDYTTYGLLFGNFYVYLRSSYLPGN